MKQLKYDRMTERISCLSLPVIYELPIFISFFVFTRSWVYFLNLFVLFQGIWNDSVEVSLESLSIWFLMAYLFAFIIHFTKSWKIKFLYYFQLTVLLTISRFCILNFDLDVSPTLLTLIAETNGRETKEFFSTYLFSDASYRCYLEIAFFIAFCLITEFSYHRCLKRLTVGKLSRFIVSMIVGAILIFGVFQIRWYIKLLQYDGEDTETFFGMKRPANDFYSNLVYSIKFVQVSKKQQDKAIELIAKLPKTDCLTDDSINIVLVIGESYIKCHSFLYGNPLNTTPIQVDELKRGNLFAFNDAITPYAYTTMAIKNMMCCNNVSEGELWCDYPYFPAIFQKAGFDVYFWDNQKEMEHGSMLDFTLNSFLNNKQMSYTKANKHSFQYDESIVDDFKKEVPIMKNKKNFIIFHLQGQHVDTSERFPHKDQFLHFTPESIERDDIWINKEKKQTIADYENATFYNDYVIGRMMDCFRNSNTVLIYLSDHGHEVYDYRDKMGRDVDFESPAIIKLLFDIPFVIWVSDSYKDSHEKQIEEIHNAINHPFSSDDLCHLFFHLGNISTNYYNEERDLLSPKYKARKRSIHGHRDYDKLTKGK